MSEPVLKQRSTDVLDDFERRLRHATAAPAAARHEDPLAELARLVGEPYDPLSDVFAREAAPPRDDSHFRTAAGMTDAHAREPGYAPDVPKLFGDFAAIEAGLRGGAMAPQHHAPVGQGHGVAGGSEGAYVQAGQLPLDNEGGWTGVAPGEAYAAQGYPDARGYPGERARTHRPMTLMAVSIAAGVIGIGAAFALKGRVASSPREVKTIMADASPTKIQPPPAAAGDSGGDAAVGKGNGIQPTKLVSREEQPVDIGQAVQDNVARAAQMNPPTDAASVPVPPSPGQMEGRAVPGGADPIGAQVQGFGLAEMPAPKRVKVVSVRPDGTILPGDGDGAAPRQASAAPTAKASTPKVAPGKTTSRVAAKPVEEKTIEEVAAADDDASKPARKGKPQRVASADAEAAEAPAAPDGGGFAVQLAAPTSESDAKSASSRLSKKFSDALGSRRIAIRKAESNGRSVYRVRVSSLSRSEATSLCEKLKADGGSCFVAKN